ncbi:MAG: hypothetical protein QNJ97_14075 [Myxococcota bacterium]|nr:hypothetical protein [Myxococcota bacterium]
MYRIGNHWIIVGAVSSGMALLAQATSVNAQEPEATSKVSLEDPTITTNDTGAALPSDEEAAAQDVGDGAQEQDSEIDQLRAEFKAETERQQKRNEALQEQVDALTDRLDQSELDAMQAELSETESATRFFDMYGFFDVNFFYYQIEKGKMPYGIFTDSVSFSVSQLNLYFLSQMTETLSALIELRFTFLPQGHEKSFQMPIIGAEYNRIDTTVFDPFTNDEFQLGGVAIERVHLTYAPRDWFNVLVGHYLTPFGIWNVDHGSPVRLLVRHPYFMSREIIPLHQTGIQVFGRFFPTSHLYLDYAVTLSNGRGPTEAIYDLDNNKAVGLRLKATYEKKENSLSMGGYFYYGESTDVTKSITLDNSYNLEIDVEKFEHYTEISGAFDFVLTLFGIKLQFEYTGGIVKYDTHPPVIYPIFYFQDVQGAIQPNYLKTGLYGLVAYEFVIDRQDSKMRFIPFFMIEFTEHDDTVPEATLLIYRGGFNFKPSSFITLKYELVRGDFAESDIMNPFWIHSGQLAVSF